MSAALIDRLTGTLGYPLVTAAEVDGLAAASRTRVLFLTDDPETNRETNDVAVVLPELAMAFSERLEPAVLRRGDEDRVAARFGITVLPALLFLRDGGVLGVIQKMRDWDVFLERTAALLATEAKPLPAAGASNEPAA